MIRCLLKANKEELEFLKKYVLDDSMYWLISNESYRKIQKIRHRMKDRNNIVGKIGEIVVYDNLYNQLIKYGFKYSNKAKPNTFRIRKFYRGKKRARRHNTGIDLYLIIIDNKGKKYRCLIEVSNWGKYHSINDYLLDTRILDKFSTYDRLDRCFHIIAINNRNIRLIQDRCQKENILFLPLKEHYSTELIDKLDKEGVFDTDDLPTLNIRRT